MNHCSYHHDSGIRKHQLVPAEPIVSKAIIASKATMNTTRLTFRSSLPVWAKPAALKFLLATLIVACACVFVTTSGPVWAAGIVTTVSGAASVLNEAGETRAISEKMRIETGDTIITGKNGEVIIVTDDKGVIAMRANSRLHIDDYVANGDEKDRASYTLLKGFMRSVTGWIGKVAPRNYKIRAANATIGIRGTDHEVGLVDGDAGAGASAGVYSKVDEGETTLANPAGEVSVKAGRAAFVDFSKPAAPRLLDRIPPIFKPGLNEKTIDATKKKLAAEIEEKLKQRRSDIKRDGGTDSNGNTRINEACSGTGIPTEELMAFMRAYESGNLAVLQAKLDPAMLGYQRFIDGLIQDFNRQKQTRMLVKDIQVQCGADLATVQFTWEKRYLDVVSFAPAFLTGRGTMLMHHNAGKWQAAAFAGDNPFSGFAGSLGQLTFGPAFNLASVSALSSNVPMTIEVVDNDLAGIGSLNVQIVTSQGDAEKISLPEIAPGQFRLNSLIVSSGAVAQGNGIVEVANGVVLTLRYVDQNPGNNLPPQMLTKILKPVGSILIVTDTTPDLFSFTPVANAVASAPLVSNSVTVTGINAPASISIVGGAYAINGSGMYVTSNGVVTNNQTVQVRVTASPNSGGVASATLTIGGVQASFIVTTINTILNATPIPYSFNPQINVPPSTLITSNPAATISGINTASPVSIIGGDFSINGGAFVTSASITNNQSLAVRVLSSATPGTITSATVSVGGVAATFSVKTAVTAANSIADPFVFNALSNVATNQSFNSNAVTISGINVPTLVTISGGSYSTDGGLSFKTTSSMVSNGQSIIVQLQSSSLNLITTSATLNAGGTMGTFSVTTVAVAGNATPTPFSFTPQTNVAQSTLITSVPAATITGINIASPVSIVGGDFSIGGGGFVTSGFISNNQTLAVRVLSASTAGAVTSATVNVGGVAATFSVTTTAIIPNAVPSPYSFTPQTNVAQSTLIISTPAATITGINIASPVSIVGGTFSINGGGFVTSGSITNNQTLAVSVLSSAALGTATSATVTVGGVAATFTVTTIPPVTAPTPFSFTSQTNVAPSVIVTSTPATTITGINAPAPISVSGGSYSINGGGFTTIAGFITNLQTVALRTTSSGLTNGSGVVSVTLNIGGVIGTFTATTFDTTPNAFSFANLVTAINFLAATGCNTATVKYTTTPVSITGITAPAPVSVTAVGSNPGATLIINGVPSGTSGSISNGQTVAVQVNTVVTATGPIPTTRAIVNIGGVTANVTQTCQ